MCDMQNMPSNDDNSCDEDSEMNFATFSAGGTHFVTTGGQLPVTKLQQNVTNNGNNLSQVVGMVGGVTMGENGMQYVRSLDGGTLQATPQLITLPIALPGTKPGDPQPTVQIQVLNPNLLQAQQQPKYHMQIPIQGLQNGAVLTLAYSPETNDAGSIQLVGQNSIEGLQLVNQLTGLPPEMQLIQPSQAQAQDNEQNQTPMHQVFITPNQQIIINSLENQKVMNNNTTLDNNNPQISEVIIKEECDESFDDESSQGTETSDGIPCHSSNDQALLKYLSQLPPQQTQKLPTSLQQFLKLNPTESKKVPIEVEVPPYHDTNVEPVAEAILGEDGTLRIKSKKRKKYKKKPSKPARPKPGQVVIAKASDGTPIYCCPECQMAYSDKEELEVHLGVHKIERRFICGMCGAGLKRKEHLERHKLAHNPDRPFVCSICTKGFKRREHLTLHAVLHSGVKTEICGECGKGFYRKDHLRKHTRSHESKRAREQADAAPDTPAPQPAAPAALAAPVIPEITIHVPTSSNMQTPIEINIPQHIVTSLAAAQQQQQQQAQEALEALLAQHT